jgi:transmembrane sensor
MDAAKARINPQIIDEASMWFVEFCDGDVDLESRAAFVQWLKASPQHVRAYLQISQLWEESALFAASLPAEGRELLAAAVEKDNVVIARMPMAAPAGRAQGERGPTRRSAVRRALPVAACLAIVATGIAAFAWHELRQGVYATDIGEQRTIRLKDGSVVELNTASRIRVSFTKDRRELRLLAGQALFHVAKDATRPFVVSCGSATVRAVGTQFDVYKKGTDATVTVLEGKVAISEVGVTERSLAVSLSAGEQVDITPKAVTRVPSTRVAVASATAWTQRRLMFEATPLDQVVADFNRYNTKAVVIADPALLKFHISGDFSAFDPEQLVQFMKDRFQVEVLETDAEIRISQK